MNSQHLANLNKNSAAHNRSYFKLTLRSFCACHPLRNSYSMPIIVDNCYVTTWLCAWQKHSKTATTIRMKGVVNIHSFIFRTRGSLVGGIGIQQQLNDENSFQHIFFTDRQLGLKCGPNFRKNLDDRGCIKGAKTCWIAAMWGCFGSAAP